MILVFAERRMYECVAYGPGEVEAGDLLSAALLERFPVVCKVKPAPEPEPELAPEVEEAPKPKGRRR
jgi:hypothetical protein